VNTPPAWSGCPADSDPKLWELYEAEMKSVYREFLAEYNQWMVEHGAREQEFKFPFLQEFSPWANIYIFPKELDYTPLRPNPPNWHQFDTFMRGEPDSIPFEIPPKLRDGPGKLIYFSLGTIGCINVPLMKRLIRFLAQSPNRFIVSKGKYKNKMGLDKNLKKKLVRLSFFFVNFI